MVIKSVVEEEKEGRKKEETKRQIGQEYRLPRNYRNTYFSAITTSIYVILKQF